MKKKTNDYEKGMVAGAKPFEEKYTQMADSIERIGETLSHDINAIGEVQESLIGILDEKEKKELFDLNTVPDVKKILDGREQEYLVASVLTIVNELENINDYQKIYIRNLLTYLEIKRPQIKVELSYIENVDRLTSQKAILHTILEVLYLGNASHQYYYEFLSYFELFAVTEKQKYEMMEKIEVMSRIIGLQGIAERYGEKKAESIDLSDYVKLSGDDVDEYSIGAEIKKRIRMQRYKRQVIHITDVMIEQLLNDETNMWEFIECEIYYGGDSKISIDAGTVFFRFEKCKFYYEGKNIKPYLKRGRSLFEFLETNHMDATVYFVECIFEECGPLFVFGSGRNRKIKVVINKSVIQEPLEGFLDGIYDNSAEFNIKSSEILIGNNFYIEEIYDDRRGCIFDNGHIEFENCRIQYIGDEQYKIDNAKRKWPRTIMDGYQQRCYKCIFINCRYIMASHVSKAEGIDSCIFYKCSDIAYAWYEGVITNCYFIKCDNTLFCINGRHRFAKNHHRMYEKTYLKNSHFIGISLNDSLEGGCICGAITGIENCVFEDVRIQNGYLIDCKETTSGENEIMSLKNCVFKNCMTTRSDNIFIKDEAEEWYISENVGGV